MSYVNLFNLWICNCSNEEVYAIKKNLCDAATINYFLLEAPSLLPSGIFLARLILLLFDLPNFKR